MDRRYPNHFNDTSGNNNVLTVKRIIKGGVARASRVSAWVQTKSGTGCQFCNCCRRQVAKFYHYGGRPFGCPLCRSSTRERLVIELIDRGLLPISETIRGVLHVAPSEKGIIRRFSSLPDYHPVDLFPELYPATSTQRLDLMELDAVHRYDIVYLSHVMEHVPDDMQVLQNLYRSLKPGGQAWILVPLWDQPTEDGNPGMSGREREQRFGQWDHARQYGPDLAQRMENAGFSVHIVRPAELGDATISRLGLQKDDWVFCGAK